METLAHLCARVSLSPRHGSRVGGRHWSSPFFCSASRLAFAHRACSPAVNNPSPSRSHPALGVTVLLRITTARVMGRLVQPGPDDPLRRCGAGVSLVHAGQPGRAVDHPREYLDRVPTAGDADAVRGFPDRATAEVARRNESLAASRPSPGGDRGAASGDRPDYLTRSRTRRVVFTPLLNSSSVGRADEPGAA